MLEGKIHWVCTTCEKEDIQVAIRYAVQLGKKAEMELVEEKRENVEIKETKRLGELLAQTGEERETIQKEMKEKQVDVNKAKEQLVKFIDACE